MAKFYVISLSDAERLCLQRRSVSFSMKARLPAHSDSARSGHQYARPQIRRKALKAVFLAAAHGLCRRFLAHNQVC